jgi:hypothetical protein
MLVEPLPALKEDLELAIVGKFVGAMQAQGQILEAPMRGKEWPDFETRTGEQRIGLEVVEIVNPDHAKKRTLQQQYLAAVLPLVEDLAPALENVAMTILDAYQDPPWPHPSSAEGQRLVQHIVQHLRADVGDIAQCGAPPRTFLRMWDFEKSRLRVGIMALRGRPIPGSIITGIDLRFSGTFPMTVTTSQALLADAIHAKIEKSYTSYEPGALWLLAYSESHFTIDDASVALARELLRKRFHPFAAIWAFVPLPGEQTGTVANVFP